jgi:2,3-bisphosphoglycerate-independent phosphoglycerate mutase
MELEFLQKLIVPAHSKIVLVVMDGLGGLPQYPGGMTELETAYTPNLDCLAARSSCGLTIPVAAGITPGSGPGHLALFGYDPIRYEIGRGAMEALGVDFELCEDDVAARGNFCTVDASGRLLDRRAGRLPTETSCKLIELLRTIEIDGVELFIEPVKEHRFAFIMRAPGLGDALTDTDPMEHGDYPLPVAATHISSERTAQIANQFIADASKLLEDKQPANMIILRGFARLPEIAKYADLYQLKSAAIAIQGMYRGVARMAGMELLPLQGDTIKDEFSALEKHWQDFDFFYLHVKKTDTCGENGDFEGKVRAIEAIDRLIPRLLALQPDVIIVGGDHSSPAVLGAHSWHPVPTIIYSRLARSSGIAEFGERACARGSLGIFPAKQIMPIALAHAGRLAKYGA